MNYLAHALLAGPDPQMRLGGLLGDFVKGPLHTGVLGYDDAILNGIALHRQIDSYADTHAAFRASRQRVSAARRRYAGIMVDLFYDHFLARRWTAYSDQPLAQFAAETYGLLAGYVALLPVELRRILPRMTQGDWFCAYADAASIGAALDGIAAHRLRRANTLAGGVEELLADYEAFEGDFLDFIADATAFAESWRAQRRARD